MEKIKTHNSPLPDGTTCCSESATPAIASAKESVVSQAPLTDDSSIETNDCCGETRKTKIDWILWGAMIAVGAGYFAFLLVPSEILSGGLHHYSHGVFELMNTMWWGLLLGIFFAGVLGKVPRELVMGVLGTGGGLTGLLRATLAGLLLDLCSHGILIIGMRLYERGASLGQTMAFLIASPWNSVSLTIILIALIGLKWTLAFVILSAVIAILSGLVFEQLVGTGVLPANPNSGTLPDGFNVVQETRQAWRGIAWSPALLKDIIVDGLKESRMILRWLLFGVALAAALRAFLSVEDFQAWFGPTLMGLAVTLVVTTLLEVCSEGSSPIAADILNRASAPGNAFTFLMAGVATDYTEIMSLKERTRSWKIALFLPLVTVPQVIAVGLLLNGFG
ncbi:MAG: permease [Methyloligellaceae bacterium]